MVQAINARPNDLSVSTRQGFYGFHNDVHQFLSEKLFIGRSWSGWWTRQMQDGFPSFGPSSAIPASILRDLPEQPLLPLVDP